MNNLVKAGLLVVLVSCVTTVAQARISSPGNVTFTNPAGLNTSAIFDSTGTFVLQLTASDGVKSSTATITITVNTSVVMPRANVGTSTGIAGNTVSLPVNFSTGTTGVAALQFDVTLPISISTASVTAGSSTLNAGKSVQTNPVTGGLRVIIFGLNQNTLGSGPVALLNLGLSPTLINQTVPITLSNISASDANGNPVPMGSANGSIVVTANKAPTVSITTPNQTITLPDVSSVTISAVATDDGAPNPPGAVTPSWDIK